jgi:hypothetical protein
MEINTAALEIGTFLRVYSEWLWIDPDGTSFPLTADEIGITSNGNKLLIEYLSRTGFKHGRIAAYKLEAEKLSLTLTGRFGKETSNAELVPRTPALLLSQNVELARLQRANKIGALMAGHTGERLIRAALNKETGRYAQIIVEDSKGIRSGAIADVSDTLTPESLLATAVLWRRRMQYRKNPVNVIRIIAAKKSAKKIQKLHALLAANWKSKIQAYEIAESGAGDELLKLLPALAVDDLWNAAKPKKIRAVESTETSEFAGSLLESAQDETDVIFSMSGETVRFLGLPFARTRRVAGEEKCWFGVETKKQVFTAATHAEVEKLISELKLYRAANSPNPQHAFYRTAPESWLEAMLRKNIRALDPNLILSPIYNQFRTDRDKIDLLAIRRDGRLVIIELKVASDREMLYQAADYWRKIELQRRAGNLQKAKIFGSVEIIDRPALVYLVAPTFSYHREFDYLAQTISREIEIYRFDLNEGWRENIKVLRRLRVT